MSSGPKREILFWLTGILVFFLALYVFRGILLPFVAGMAAAYFLDPLCDRLEKWGLSRTLATSVVTLAFLIVAVAALLLLVPMIVNQVTDLVSQLPRYLDALRREAEDLIAAIRARVDPEVMERARDLVAGSVDTVMAWLSNALGRLITSGVALANLLSLVLITPIVAFYLLRDWDRLVERIDDWLPRRQADTVREQAREVDRMLAGFVRGQATVCLILGAFYAVALTLAGLDFGLIIGIVAGLLTFIPYLGALIGGLLSIGVALLQFDNWLDVAIIALIFVVGQAVEGNLLTPKLVGDRVGLHPVWIIFALLAGGLLFGFVGVLLAVPVAAVIGVLMRFSLRRYLASEIYRGGGTPDGPADAG